MSFRQLSALLLLLSLASAPTVMAAPPSPWDTTKVVTEATSGQFKATKGKYFDKECNASLDYTTEVVDLNADGQPEVFTSVQGTCLGGMAGVFLCGRTCQALFFPSSPRAILVPVEGPPGACPPSCAGGFVIRGAPWPQTTFYPC